MLGVNLRQWAEKHRSKYLAWGLGGGLALFALHWADQPGLNVIFIPTIGFAIAVVCMTMYFTELKTKPDFGPKILWIPMLVIVASIWGRLIVEFSWYSVVSGLFGVVLFATYVAARNIGKEIFVAFIPFVVIVAVSCIIDGVLNPGEITGGIITNYCAAAGFMIFGVVVNQFRWRWVLATLVLVALFFVGALEGLFAIGVLGIIILARRDWGKKLLLPIGLVIIAAIVWGVLGHFTPLWGKYNLDVLLGISKGDIAVTDDTLNKATTGRWINIVNRMGNIQPLGREFWVTMPRTDVVDYGYHEYSSPDEEPVHNVPLVIVDQIGPVAAAAWLFITIFCLIKTKWKYAWSAIIILSVFDHYIWTQFAPYWWALVGISTSVAIKNDYIFKGG